MRLRLIFLQDVAQDLKSFDTAGFAQHSYSASRRPLRQRCSALLKRCCGKYCMRARELLQLGEPREDPATLIDARSRRGADISERSAEIQRDILRCAKLLVVLAQDHQAGRQMSKEQSTPISSGWTKQGGARKKPKPPAVPKPRALKSGPNVIKPKTMVEPPKPMKRSGK